MKRLIASIIFAVALPLNAAEPLSTSVDWREWYYYTNRTRWNNKSLSELRADAKAGHAVAKYALAKRLFKEGRDKYAEGDALIEEAAQLGLPQAIYDQALDHTRIPHDDVRSKFVVFEKAAATGYPEAQVQVAQILESGKVARPDHERALKLMRAAADAGDSDGHFNLGLMYSVGIGEPRDANDSALYHIRCAADAGNTSAMEVLAKRYRVGYTVPKDFLRSGLIFVVAASNAYGEFSDTFIRLAPTEPDAEKFNAVLDLYVAAVIRNDAKAFATLGEMHERGDGGEIRLSRAAAFFDLSARKGNTSAAGKRDVLLKKLNPDEYKAFRRDVDLVTEVQKLRMER